MSHANYQLAGGGVIGREHRQTFKNYQDAWTVMRAEHFSLAIVADGCGSGGHSEIGAKLGTKWLAEEIRDEFTMRGSAGFSWPCVQREVLARLDGLAASLGGNYRQMVEEYLLFTVNGVLLTDEQAIFFALGDGIIIVNDQTLELGPFPGNMPPYLGYGLLSNRLKIDSETVVLRPVLEMPLSEVDHFLLGTDGASDLIAAAGKPLPGLPEQCGEITQFWTDRYFKGNPDLVSRRLRLMARDFPVRDPVPGLLHDDTTIVVGRHQPEEGGEQ